MNIKFVFSRICSPVWWKAKLANNNFFRRIYSNRYITIYAASNPLLTPPVEADIKFKVCSIEDLRKFVPTETWHDWEIFTTNAAQSLKEGMLSYTAIENDVLAFYAWIRSNCKSSYFNYVGEEVFYALPKVATSYSGYVHPGFRGRGLFSAGLRFMIEDALGEGVNSFVVCSTDGDNRPAKKAHIRAGYTEIATLSKLIIFGIERASVVNHSNPKNLYLRADGKNRWLMGISEIS